MGEGGEIGAITCRKPMSASSEGKWLEIDRKIYILPCTS